jgi:exonuclease SbcC
MTPAADALPLAPDATACGKRAKAAPGGRLPIYRPNSRTPRTGCEALKSATAETGTPGNGDAVLDRETAGEREREAAGDREREAAGEREREVAGEREREALIEREAAARLAVRDADSERDLDGEREAVPPRLVERDADREAVPPRLAERDADRERDAAPPRLAERDADREREAAPPRLAERDADRERDAAPPRLAERDADRVRDARDCEADLDTVADADSEPLMKSLWQHTGSTTLFKSLMKLALL